MNGRPTAGLSLIELVVALGLLGLVMALAGALLVGARQNAEFLRTEPPREAMRFADALQEELDRCLRAPKPESLPDFALVDGQPRFPAALPDENGVLHPVGLAYLFRDSGEIWRIETRPPPQGANTSVVLRGVRSFLLRAPLPGGEWTNTWPEALPHPPALLRLELDLATEPPLRRNFLIPAHLLASPTSSP